MLKLLLQFLLSAFRTRHCLALENVALRHQIEVLHRNSSHPRLRGGDRVFWNHSTSSSQKESSAGTARISGSTGDGKADLGGQDGSRYLAAIRSKDFPEGLLTRSAFPRIRLPILE